MLAVVGDIHGEFWRLQDIVRKIEQNKQITAIIQVGDFGYYPDRLRMLRQCQFNIPVYWIDGNHEDFELFVHFTEITEVHDNCFYVPRGTVMELDGKTVGFMGGAGSIDKFLRARYNAHWSPLENITDEQFARMNDVASVDVLITHTPPQSVIDKNFDQSPDAFAFFGAPPNWFDPNARLIESLWSRLNFPPMYCGHMHRRVSDRSCRILDICEVDYID